VRARCVRAPERARQGGLVAHGVPYRGRSGRPLSRRHTGRGGASSSALNGPAAPCDRKVPPWGYRRQPWRARRDAGPAVSPRTSPGAGGGRAGSVVTPWSHPPENACTSSSHSLRSTRRETALLAWTGGRVARLRTPCGSPVRRGARARSTRTGAAAADRHASLVADRSTPLTGTTSSATTPTGHSNHRTILSPRSLRRGSTRCRHRLPPTRRRQALGAAPGTCS
jgi:hypothetical protein